MWNENVKDTVYVLWALMFCLQTEWYYMGFPVLIIGRKDGITADKNYDDRKWGGSNKAVLWKFTGAVYFGMKNKQLNHQEERPLILTYRDFLWYILADWHIFYL